ncbi:S8 family serine peptidase [Dactylosporangium sp. CS-033363]|uniref:S8 family serine peptidase n=1 Tax=Dactylosporangium sp. CS-033363 TaxID=3239935 RepID=UPI003D89B1ED
MDDVNRDELTALFYGTAALPPPWATDCPVRFDAWWAFAEQTQYGLDHRVDVILTIHEEHGIRTVFEQLLESGSNKTRPVAVGGFVVVSVTLRQLVQVVMPMTNLAGLLDRARRLAPDEMVELLNRPPEVAAARPERRRGIGFAQEDYTDEGSRAREYDHRLAWFLRLLGAVTDSAAGPAGGVDLDFIAEMLRHAVPAERPRGAVDDDRRRRYPVASVTTNRKAGAAVTRSRATVKADAAEQVFAIDCSTIGWAVVDSGIDYHHPAFKEWKNLHGELEEPTGNRILRAFDFSNARRVLADRAKVPGLVDWRDALPFVEVALELERPRSRSVPPQLTIRKPGDPHGTHVAGVLGGNWPERGLRGVCPDIKLYDFRVLDDVGNGDEFSVLAALQAIRYINDQAGRLVIAGVNLSLSVPHDVATHACGWTPVCQEAERLVRSGVVVVSAAGNAGFGELVRTNGAGYNPTSISDPGNADAVITVGSTHRSNPHRHGVSYFSGRGPTADGRAKPDLIAPGEDIDGPIPGEEIMAMHGTSQAAAHVSGAAAMLMARHRELIGRPERIKEVLCATATDLRRERAFQGSGVVDVLRAIQSI